MTGFLIQPRDQIFLKGNAQWKVIVSICLEYRIL